MPAAFNLMSSDIAFSLDVEIKRLRKHTVVSFWKLIALLKQARRMDIWEKLGYGSWSSYLAQPEISLKTSSVDNYITALNRFQELKLPESEYTQIPKTKAVMIAPHLSEGDPKELIEQAKAMSWSDLKAEIGLLKGEEEPEETGRPRKPKIKWCDKHQKWSIKKEDLKSMCVH